MRFEWTEELLEFRQEVRAFGANGGLPFGGSRTQNGRTGPPLKPAPTSRTWTAVGWLRRSWPKELGGEEQSPWYQFLLALELGYLGVDYGRRGTSSMIGPAIQKFGTDHQKTEYLAQDLERRDHLRSRVLGARRRV